MIKQENIRTIPKYMLERIKKLDEKYNSTPHGKNRFYTYFTKYNKELCSVTVAVRNKYKKWYCKQVVVHGIHTDKVYLRDIGQSMGFILIGWNREGLTKYRKWYDYDWGYTDDKYFQMNTAIVVNREYILTLPEFKYSAVDKYTYSDILNYLRLYEKYPQCEYLVKAGLSKFATSKQILNKCSKDKTFCKWLIKNKDEISNGYFYTQTLLNAYNQNKPLKEVQRFLDLKKRFEVRDNFRELKEVFSKDINKFITYLSKQNIDASLYTDYLHACQYLGINMNVDKNRYPHNFEKWHDIRIDEYHTAKMEADKKERKAFYKKFSNVANKYLPLQRKLKDEFVALIAQSPADLIKEGEKLNHCVGRMNYDQKFAREESLIFFIRNKNSIDNPFVTVEYSLKSKKIVQCYGEHDSKPNDNVLDYVNKVWLPYANRKLRQLGI